LKDKQHFSLASHLCHVQKRAEEAIPEVAEILGSSSSGNPDGIGICVCDANISGKAAVDKLLRPMLKFLEHGCRLVLTIKLQRRTGGEGVTKHNNVSGSGFFDVLLSVEGLTVIASVLRKQSALLKN